MTNHMHWQLQIAQFSLMQSAESTTSQQKSKQSQANGKHTLNSWDTDQMAQAVNEFAEGKLSLRQISRAWNIPKSTLQRRVCGKVKHCEHASGRHPALPNNVEIGLRDYLTDLSRRRFPLRPMEVPALVYQFALKHGYSGIGSAKTMPQAYSGSDDS